MRILHVAPTAFGGEGLFGGGERYPLELARATARLPGVRSELVTFGGHHHEWHDSSGLRVRVLPTWWQHRRHPAHPVAPRLLASLGDADVVHAHHLGSIPSLVTGVVGRLRRQATVVTDLGLGGGKWFGLLPHLFDRLLAVSRYSAALLDFPPAKTTIVYGGADPLRFSPRADEARDGVLAVGRLTPHKGFDCAITALPPGATLTIAGTAGHDPVLPERDYPDHLRQLATGRDVRFAREVDDTELAGLYRRAAVLVMPSVEVTCYGRTVAVSELLGLTAIEAMASGTPVVASRLGGLAEVVVDGETGFLVEPGDTIQLRARIEELLNDPQRARRMGDAARRLVIDRFTWDACARRCVDAYRQVLRRSRRRRDSRAPQTTNLSRSWR
jgi:glycosyltransferase involved in cell wall biosynthesis